MKSLLLAFAFLLISVSSLESAHAQSESKCIQWLTQAGLFNPRATCRNEQPTQEQLHCTWRLSSKSGIGRTAPAVALDTCMENSSIEFQDCIIKRVENGLHPGVAADACKKDLEL